MKEPNIIINGTGLSEGQSMTVRVALNHFASYLEDPHALGNDAHGVAMRDGYLNRIREMFEIIGEGRES